VTYLRDYASSTESGMRAEVLAMVERAQKAASTAIALSASDAQGYVAIIRRAPHEASVGYSDEELDERDSAARSLAELVERFALTPA
jgi:hypothetical protein